MTFSKISKFIEENKHEAIFTGGTNENNIKWIEETLQVELPESYKWFLKNYGSGGIFGVEILGYDLEGAYVVEQTEDYRKYYNLPDGIVVIEYVDEFSYCLDTNKMEDGECPVIVWANDGGYGNVVAHNFLEFFMKDLKESKENWEEDEDWDDEE
ncbi:SMI1/KNR4 family protein [Bacillus paralicheniformis]|uniref:SMI1/KNR4 family protein n=1 Tax=Bacillus TaxID=1386 RepID=UPI001C233DEA|nr:SMI1/KNR4 family protein [Bacillus paralicheniformis]MBU8582111.1 SMI1/KNR4 family protein [Bacillus paralicheniformis]MCY8181497.1 SMI1/KNR4 family protein [Bacillus paralicheniformis]